MVQRRVLVCATALGVTVIATDACRTRSLSFHGGVSLGLLGKIYLQQRPTSSNRLDQCMTFLIVPDNVLVVLASSEVLRLVLPRRQLRAESLDPRMTCPERSCVLASSTAIL